MMPSSLSREAGSSAIVGTGACSAAAGSQVCRGTAPAFARAAIRNRQYSPTSAQEVTTMRPPSPEASCRWSMLSICQPPRANRSAIPRMSATSLKPSMAKLFAAPARAFGPPSPTSR